MFAFTSLGGRIDQQINTGGGPYVFRLNGHTYHRMGPLLPVEGKKPMYAQFYMYDAVDDLIGRLNVIDSEEVVNETTVQNLTVMLDRENELVKIFRNVCDRFKESDYLPVKLRLLAHRDTDARETDMPRNAFEFGALIRGDDLANSRDIFVEYKTSELIRISEFHPSFLSLQYPLLFPYGEDGYRLNILHRSLPYAVPHKQDTVTMREYDAYWLQYRLTEGQTLLRGRRLFLQYVVDAWSCIEHERLSFILHNQGMLGADVYNNIVDCFSKGDTDAANIGKRIILPANFTGGPRYMHQNYQDCMDVCRRYSNPYLFIIFTCNPKWPEILYFLQGTPNADPTCRPDIIARVFKIKVGQLIDDLTKKHILDRVVALAYTIEFQKRGLPHVHIILWLTEADQFHTTEQINKIISAEIPNKDTDPKAYEAVAQFMIRGPCGPCNSKSPCISLLFDKPNC